MCKDKEKRDQSCFENTPKNKIGKLHSQNSTSALAPVLPLLFFY